MGWLALGSPLGSTLRIQKFMSLSLHLVTTGADLGKGHSPSEILNPNERLFSAFSLFFPQRMWLKDST